MGRVTVKKQQLTKEQMLKALPKKQQHTITDDFVRKVNELAEDPDIRDSFKEGIIGLFRSLKHETAYYDVSLHLVIPGFVKTQIFQKAMYRCYTESAAMESIKSLGLPMTSKQKAAMAISKGVKKGKSIIMFSFYARLFVCLARLCPAALIPFYKRLLSGCPKSPGS